MHKKFLKIFSKLIQFHPSSPRNSNHVSSSCENRFSYLPWWSDCSLWSKAKLRKKKYRVVCFIRRFDHCMSKDSNKDDPIYKKAAEGRNGCLKKFVKNEKIENAYGFATCLYEWVKLHFKRHWNVYKQNPITTLSL